MPGFDRTGPQGRGPMTGGRRGMCGPGASGRGRGVGYGAGYGAGYGPGLGRGGYGRGAGYAPGWGAGYAPEWGAGYGPGRGMGGWMQRCWAFFRPPGAPVAGFSPQDERAYLRGEAEALRRSLGEIERRLDSLRSEDREGPDREGPDREGPDANE